MTRETLVKMHLAFMPLTLLHEGIFFWSILSLFGCIESIAEKASQLLLIEVLKSAESSLVHDWKSVS